MEHRNFTVKAMVDLTGRVALVTGAQQGIGRASVLAYAAAGASVVVNWLDDERAAQSLIDEVAERNHADSSVRALAIRGDVRSQNDIASLLDAADDLGGADILLNNAAIFPRVAFVDISETQFDEVMDVNLKGSFRVAQEFSRRAIARAAAATIINVSSGAAWYGSPRGVHYVTAKAGIIGMTRALALELAPSRIRVNAIAPGLTDTAQPRFGMSESEIESAAERVPLGRIAVADDIASMAVFLASDGAGHCTGQTFHVNGGQLLR